MDRASFDGTGKSYLVMGEVMSKAISKSPWVVHFNCERIREAADMTGSNPGLGVHQNGSIQAHVIGGLLHKLFQPCLLHIVLELHTQRAVVLLMEALLARTREHHSG